MSPEAPRGVFTLQVPHAVRRRLHREFRRLPPAAKDLEGLLAGLLQAASQVPRDFLRQLLWFRASPQAPGALLLTGMPIDEDLPPTPTKPAHRPFKTGHVSECAILFIAILLGEPVAYAEEKDGALVQDVFPTRSQRTTPSNESSSVALAFHTELTFSRMAPEQSFDVAAPDFVLLLALRSPRGRSATTSVVEARDLCARLDAAHVAALREPRFRLRAPHSFVRDAGRSRPWSPPLALIRGPDEALSMAFDIACGVRALSPEADTALRALRAACADPALQRSVQLRPGDLLAIDNNRCAHARSRYEARFDGRDRWLRRAYVRRSLRALTPRSEGSFRVLA
jgi:L-asparagine oxygenase